MFTKFRKTAPTIFSYSLKRTITPQTKYIAPFSSIQQADILSECAIIEDKRLSSLIKANDAHINEYMKKLYRIMAGAATVGISSAYLLSATVPLGFPSALLILTGFGLEHLGTDYIEKTKPTIFQYKGKDGTIQYGIQNSPLRKIALASTCIGYGCIMASVLSMIPVAASVLPLSLITCLFSSIGHIAYCRFTPKPRFNTTHLFVSGLLTGVLGLNLIASGSAVFMLGGSLHFENVEFASYLGMLLFNAFTANDSQKVLEDVAEGKGDYLKHGNKFAENWLYTLVPQFLIGM